MIVATAPGRCGLAGTPTDMYGGSVLSCTTRERARCTLTPADTLTVTVSGQTQTFCTPADLALHGDFLDVARAVLSVLGVQPGAVPGFHLCADTQVPMQAGLAGSTAILAALVGCMLAHLDTPLHLYQTAELVRRIESDTLGIVCGFQDHYMTVFGGLNFMDFRGKLSAQAQNDITPYATIEPLQHHVTPDLPLLLAHTGIQHHSGSVHATPRERWLAGDPAVVDGYREAALLAAPAKRALLSADWHALAALMTRNHALVRDLGGSGPANEALIAAALDGGALGAKLAGAGGGGTILALTLNPARTEQALLAAGAEQVLYPQPAPGLTVRTSV